MYVPKRMTPIDPDAPRRLAPECRRPADAPNHHRVKHCGPDQHELDVRDRRRVVETLLVDQRVARDEVPAASANRNPLASARRYRTDAADEQDPRADGDHAGDLARGRVVPEEEYGTREHADGAAPRATG